MGRPGAAYAAERERPRRSHTWTERAHVALTRILVINRATPEQLPPMLTPIPEHLLKAKGSSGSIGLLLKEHPQMRAMATPDASCALNDQKGVELEDDMAPWRVAEGVLEALAESV